VFLLLVWGLAGSMIYIFYLVETPQDFALTAETAVHREAYAQYISDIPTWAIAIGIGAALARLLGAVLLLFRRRPAFLLYIISTLLFLAAMFRAFVVARVAEVMSGPHIAIEFVFLALSFYAVWFARRSASRGILR